MNRAALLKNIFLENLFRLISSNCLLPYARSYFFVFLWISLYQHGISQDTKSQAGQNSERVSGWRSDIDTLLMQMKWRHYVYKSKPLPHQLLANATRLKKKIARYSDERMLFEMEKLMFYMRDGHSYVLPTAGKIKSFFLPVQFYVFSDGTYIIDADGPYKDLIGCRVLSINGVALSSMIHDMNHYVHQDNKYTVLWFAPTFLRYRGLYEMYGLPAGSTEIKIILKNQNKRMLSRNISFIPAGDLRGIPKLFPSKMATDKPAPLYLSDVQDFYWFKLLPEWKTVYFQFNQVIDKEVAIDSFAVRLDTFLQTIKPRLFIIDVRHNNGGSLEYLPPLISVVKKFEKTNPNSRIIVITGRNTFSAAQVFISTINKETHAIFAGEPSSSSPNFVGEEGNMFFLPYSGAMGNISTKFHESIPGDKRKWIEPRYKISLSSQDYFNNLDPVMNYLLKKIVK